MGLIAYCAIHYLFLLSSPKGHPICILWYHVISWTVRSSDFGPLLFRRSADCVSKIRGSVNRGSHNQGQQGQSEDQGQRQGLVQLTLTLLTLTLVSVRDSEPVY